MHEKINDTLKLRFFSNSRREIKTKLLLYQARLPANIPRLPIKKITIPLPPISALFGAMRDAVKIITEI